MTQDTAPERASMHTVVVKKDRLVEALTKNRDAHRALFEKALEGYRTRSIELLEDHIERIKKNKIEKVAVVLPLPEDHTADYERALASLDWTVFDEVDLSMQEFDCYVNDNWQWKREFTTSTAAYVAA